jgi:hypothetical protein
MLPTSAGSKCVRWVNCCEYIGSCASFGPLEQWTWKVDQLTPLRAIECTKKLLATDVPEQASVQVIIRHNNPQSASSQGKTVGSRL